MIDVHCVPDAFSIVECDRILAAVSDRPAREALLVGRNKDHNLRTAQLVWLDEVEGLGWVMDRLIDLVRVANRDRFDFDIREFAESPQLAIYQSSDNGHFAWHSDIGNGPLAAKRKLTLVLQLSDQDAYDGGELQIMPSAQVISAKRAKGCVTIFPSFTLHQVTPVERGTRQSVTVWAHGPAFR